MGINRKSVRCFPFSKCEHGMFAMYPSITLVESVSQVTHNKRLNDRVNTFKRNLLCVSTFQIYKYCRTVSDNRTQ